MNASFNPLISHSPEAQGLRRQLEAPAIEARVAARLAAGLSEQTQALLHDISERLRVAREQAVARARAVRAARVETSAAAVLAGGQVRGAAWLAQGASWLQWLAAVAPVGALVTGLVLIDRQGQLEQVHAAAQIDAQLLADDLPPVAYTDPGFAEFLRTAAYSPSSSVNAQVSEGD